MIGFLDLDLVLGGMEAVVSTGSCAFARRCLTTGFFPFEVRLTADFFATGFAPFAIFLMTFFAFPLCEEDFVFAAVFFLVPFFFVVAILTSSK
jgi:hypothetical protein